jgi:hypothetical protein
MSFSRRSSCVLCKSTSLQPFYRLTEFPLLNHSTLNDLSDDRYVDYEYCICDKCQCVQLLTLLDPSILYASDNKTKLTALWEQHHSSFASFVSKGLRSSSICEIGGGSNNLSSYFPAVRYSILDMYEPTVKDARIEYRTGNCEEFFDYTDKALLLSHTFEHLYSPHKFLKCLQESNVEQVFISVPNMKSWLENKTTCFLIFNQHTFYFDKDDIIALFSQYGFECDSNSEFQGHSLFFSFIRNPLVNPICIPRKTIAPKILEHFQEKETLAASISTSKKLFIMPSFYLGQLAYFFLKNHLEFIGFLDNDLNKVNKRLYGTPLNVFLPNEIQKYNPETTAILIVNSPYLSEMKEQLKCISPDFEIFSLTF